MKKSIIAIGLAIAGVIHAQDVPSINVTTKTNIVTVVEPIKLTSLQMAGIITAVETGGISANVPITTDNLQAVMVRKGTNGEYTVYIQVK
jgi:hypothetical protein